MASRCPLAIAALRTCSIRNLSLGSTLLGRCIHDRLDVLDADVVEPRLADHRIGAHRGNYGGKGRRMTAPEYVQLSFSYNRLHFGLYKLIVNKMKIYGGDAA